MSNTFIPFENVRITGSFWQRRQLMNSKTTLRAVYDRFVETGRIGALDFTYLSGDAVPPHIFWDSDIAKWLEAAAYDIKLNATSDIETLADEIIDKITLHQRADGYYNMYFQQVEPEQIFRQRTQHELYCAGHLMEAAVAYYHATGKRKLLDAMCRYADLIEKVFVTDASAGFQTPGHEEIELALVRLWEATGENRYLHLARHFINMRGTQEESEYEANTHQYSQSHLPVREQFTAEGHAVRAMYLYCAMADLARIDADDALMRACKKLFDSVTSRRMYITGGIGSTSLGEAFTIDFDLPNMTAYSESCAAIGLMLFCQRLTRLEADSRYADTVERILYNGFLSAVSLHGDSFFYVNPLEINPSLLYRDVSIRIGRRTLPLTQRQYSFDCSCCPPNIARIMPLLGGFLYSISSDTLYVHQFMESKATIDGFEIMQQTTYPNDGNILLQLTGSGVQHIAIRRPFWCQRYSILVNGIPMTCPCKKGYLILDALPNMEIELRFEMEVCLIHADPNVAEDCGKVAVMRGPIVYCAEGIDNVDNLKSFILTDTFSPSIVYKDEYGCPTLMMQAWQFHSSGELYSSAPCRYDMQVLHMIPYFAFANRGTTEMAVWFPFSISAQ